MFKHIILLLSVLTFVSSCASIVDGKSQQMTFQSTPAGAEVLINGIVKGKTPLTIDVLRAENTSLTIRKDGFSEQTLVMKTGVNGMFFGNILIGGLPGTTTDVATGANIEYTPGVHFITLEQLNQLEETEKVTQAE